MTAALSLVPNVTSWPPGPITPHAQYWLQTGIHPECAYRSPDDTQIFQIYGPKAPVPGVQPGVALQTIEGLLPSWRLLDQQGARQDGVTNMGAVLDPIVMKANFLVSGRMPRQSDTQAVMLKRQVTRAWIDSWNADQLGEFSWHTPHMGKWWGKARWSASSKSKMINAISASQVFDMTIRIDAGVWQSVPSTSQFPKPGDAPLSGSASGWLPLSNRGDRKAFPAFVAYGPFDQLSIANGPGSQSMITFGPLLAGQCVLLNTDQRLPLLVDLSQTAIAQALNPFSTLLTNLLSFATNNDTAPLLSEFESQFGVLPPQTTLEALVSGRFTNPVPAKPIAAPPVTSNIAISITGATAATRVVGSLTPLRRWPE